MMITTTTPTRTAALAPIITSVGSAGVGEVGGVVPGVVVGVVHVE